VDGNGAASHAEIDLVRLAGHGVVEEEASGNEFVRRLDPGRRRPRNTWYREGEERRKCDEAHSGDPTPMTQSAQGATAVACPGFCERHDAFSALEKAGNYLVWEETLDSSYDVQGDIDPGSIGSGPSGLVGTEPIPSAKRVVARAAVQAVATSSAISENVIAQTAEEKIISF
jgi:hypothetical protein